MFRMKLKKFHIVLLLAVIIAWACDDEIIILENPDLVFSNSFQIHIPPYEYQDNSGSIISVRGDSSYQSSYADTLTNQPVFAWEGLEDKIVCVALLTEPIEVSHGEVLSDHVIWRWNSGMSADQTNRISYSEGREVRGGLIVDPGQIPDPLETGHYYWAVWSWRDSGTKILYSSRQQEFYVSE